jgi:hypothetical protein
MTRTEVARHLGVPEFLDNPDMPLEGVFPDGERVMEFRLYGGDSRKTQPAIEYLGDSVVSVEVFDVQTTLKLGEIELFKNTLLATSKLLADISAHYAHDETSYVFLDLGISMDTDSGQDTETINIFARGEFDEHVAEWVERGHLTVVRK